MKHLDKEACFYRALLVLAICGLAIYDGTVVAIVAAAIVVYGFGCWWELLVVWADHCARFRRPGTSQALKRVTLVLAAVWFLAVPIQAAEWLAGKWQHSRQQKLQPMPETVSQPLT